MKKGLLTLILLMLAYACLAGNTGSDGISRITYGVEWSYSAAFFKGYHNYFSDPDGFRVEQRVHEASYYTNGEAYLHAGFNLDENWNLSAYLGYSGVGDFHTGLPLSLRMTRYFNENSMGDRWFAYCDVGSGISIKNKPQELITGKLGGGYRLSMSRYTKLDFIAALRIIHTHPDIKYYELPISQDQISHNVGYVISASFGIGITF